MKIGRFALAVILFAVVSQGVAGPDKATEAQEMVEKCLAMFKDKGREATVLAVKDPKGPFVSGDLYVFVLSLDNFMVAHPYDKNLRGMNMNNVRDSNGVHVFVKFREAAEDPEGAWIAYTWNKPGESVPSPKRSFVKRVPGFDLYVGCGYYPQ